MSFIAKLFFPKMPAMPQITLPEVKDVPSYEDEARKLAERAELEASERKRKGRRSTILTGGTGLTTDPELNTPTLLGE